MLSGMDPFHQITVSASGQISVISEVTTADVWRGNEDIFCREAWRIAGEDLYGIRDAMCSEKERA